jgi:hypothetical protein
MQGIDQNYSRGLVVKFVDYRTRKISDVEKTIPSPSSLASDYRVAQFEKLLRYIRCKESNHGDSIGEPQTLVLEIDLSMFESTEDMKQRSPVLVPTLPDDDCNVDMSSTEYPITEYFHNFFSCLNSDDSDEHSLSIQLFVITFSYDLRLLYFAIQLFMDQFCERMQQTTLIYSKQLNISFASIDLQITMVEDLIYIDRPYIMESKHKNFFKNISGKYSDQTLTTVSKVDGTETKITFPTVKIESSNCIMNQWGEGDCKLISIPEFQRPDERVEIYWHRILSEIAFSEMFNQGNKVPRLISIQSVADPELGRPLYRHPNDEEPPNIEMVPVVREIMSLVEHYTGVRGLNHVLIQHYRDGRDNIAQHSDKTLDIDLETPILNFSFGCPRDMFIQNKSDRNRLEKIPLHHGECVVFGLRSNQYWYHEVPKDVMMAKDLLFGTSRVSFTFRKIATYVHPQTRILIGQGSPFKSIDEYDSYQKAPESVDKGELSERRNSSIAPSSTRAELIIAFGKENRQSSEFNWQEVYGHGFLVT